ncbi:MAG TPA: hypothetical protein VGC13_27430 [Longimicrobium sp.]|jgi:hypothetical protein|uniref:hypothetical protein n=1 Tax=Longimicrobium sp. TaxID=2029185 RepID=UPI002ED88215
MIRAVLLLAAFVIVGRSSVALYADTRALLRPSRSVPELLGRGKSAGGVVIVLQVEDCRGSGSIVSGWNALHSAGRFPVRGLVVGTGEMSAPERAILKGDGVRFPLGRIAAADARSVARTLGFRSTPFAIVLDRRGRVAGAFPTGQGVSAEALARLMGRPPS